MSDTPITDAATTEGWSGDAMATDPEVARRLERQVQLLRRALQTAAAWFRGENEIARAQHCEEQATLASPPVSTSGHDRTKTAANEQLQKFQNACCLCGAPILYAVEKAQLVEGFAMHSKCWRSHIEDPKAQVLALRRALEEAWEYEYKAGTRGHLWNILNNAKTTLAPASYCHE